MIFTSNSQCWYFMLKNIQRRLIKMLKVNILHSFCRFLNLGIDMVIAKILKYTIIFCLAASGLRAQDVEQHKENKPKKEVLLRLLDKAETQLKELEEQSQ